MQYRPLGQSGISASVIAHGAWALGGWMWGGTDEDKSIRAIQASLDAGVNFIDTAPAYGLGLSERIVGKAIQGRREKAVLATKCGLVWNTDKGRYFADQDGTAIHRYLGPESVRHEVEESLKRLGTDYIDLYQTHWQDATTPTEQTMEALLDLKKEGKIRAIGVSNCTVEQVREYRAVGPLDSVQEKYSMLDREIEGAYLSYCQANHLAVLAYSPLANGLLTGNMDPGRVFPVGDLRRNNPRFSPQSRRRIGELLERMWPIAQKHNLTIGQLVIAWTIAQPGVTHALVGARDVAQANENAAAGSVVLTSRDLREISDVLTVPALSVAG